jgi:hypothetical protein
MSSSTNHRDCYHIQSAKKELVSLSEALSGTGISVPSLNDPILLKRTLLTTLRTRQQVISQRAVSYLPIAAPRWCRLDRDRIELSPPWRVKHTSDEVYHGDQDQDTTSQTVLFKLDETARCSCGFKSDVYVDDTISVNPYVVFDCNEGSRCLIETAYCSDCSNTRGRIGPDLGKHGVFNWNNEFGFTHDLLNSFTSQFSTSETTFKAFWRTTIHCYTQKLSEFAFCGYDSFKDAWFEFIQVQEIQHSMRCPHCGPNPSVVIADGISLGFASHRVESLRPPTYATQSYTVKIKAPKQSTVFRGPRKMLKQISTALKEKKVATRLERLSLVCDMLREVKYLYEIADIPRCQIVRTMLALLTVLLGIVTSWNRRQISPTNIVTNCYYHRCSHTTVSVSLSHKMLFHIFLVTLWMEMWMNAWEPLFPRWVWYFVVSLGERHLRISQSFVNYVGY